MRSAIDLFRRNQRGERRASPRTFRLLLTVHIMTAVGWLGVVLAKLVLTVGVVGTAVQVVPRIVGISTREPTLLGLPWAPAVLLAFAALHLLMLGAATMLSVYKPWGTTWFGRRDDARRPAPSRPEGRTESRMRFEARGRVERVA
jgi:hypothetical protein